jgi:hypothetical protein
VALRSCRIQVRVQPGARRDELAGRHGEAVKIRLRAAAVEGAANRGLVEFLAETLGLRRSQVRILRGERHRDKLIEIEGMVEEELWARLGRGDGSGQR